MKLSNKIVTCMIIAFNLASYSQFSGGSGTIGDPWQISNVGELQSIKDYLSSHFIQTNNIDATETSGWNDGSGFIPIGSGTYYEPTLNFKGTFNGNNYTISNLYIKYSDSEYLGLFGGLGYDAIVENVNVESSYVEGKYSTGGLVGENNGTINNCSFSGNVKGTGTWSTGGWDTGGLVGQNSYGSITDSFSDGTVTGFGDVGGLVGSNSFGTVTNSTSSVDVTGSSNIGGLIGSIFEGTIKNSYSTGNVAGTSSVGGLIGSNSEGIVFNSFYNIDYVLINGGNYITTGGIFNDQYQDWFDNGLNLNIDNYCSTLIPDGEYYVISSTDGLYDLLGFSAIEGYKFKLNNDIDLTGSPNLYIPYITSEFDGGNYTINNLNINLSFCSSLGMFGYVSDAGDVKNCNIVNAYIDGKSGLGLLAGANYGCVSNSSIQGTVNGTGGVGGLIGYNKGTIVYCSATANVSSVGGQAGGLVGNNDGTITSSYAIGYVNGDDWFVGGLVGNNYLGSIDSSYADVEVSSASRYTGGLVGSNMGTILNSYAIGNVNSIDDYAGGFVGESYGTISNSFSTGIVSGKSYVGGFTGNNYFGIVSNSYSRGNVIRKSISTSTNNGGFAGMNYKGKILNSYSTGSVQYEGSENPTDKGFCGLVNEDYEDYEMTGNYWDTETSNQITTAGTATGRTTVEMTLPYATNTYVDWDFTDLWKEDVAGINDGYPVFIWTTGIEENEDDTSNLVKGFVLSQNYPNPFNPTTHIKFDLAKTANVKLNVYNVNGQLICEVVNRIMNAGKHSIEFDGSKLNSGVYYYALNVDGTGITKKMILLK